LAGDEPLPEIGSDGDLPRYEIEGGWFRVVDDQHPEWFGLALLEVTDRELLKIEKVKG